MLLEIEGSEKGERIRKDKRRSGKGMGEGEEKGKSWERGEEEDVAMDEPLSFWIGVVVVVSSSILFPVFVESTVSFALSILWLHTVRKLYVRRVRHPPD